MDRAVELANQFVIGILSIKNTNHWLRGGTYGLQAAKHGKIGNNPLVIGVPKSNGKRILFDGAMSQFAHGKIENSALRGIQLPVPGGI